MINNNISVTILTATYNRAYILPVLYESLKKQTTFNFEWIIVDDGSTDNTNKLVQEWGKGDTEFPVKYFYKPNGGKHTAINMGVSKALSEYIFIVDSDDYLTEEAIESVLDWIETIKDKPDFAGVAGLKANHNGELIGDFPKNRKFVDATNLERKKNKLQGDKAEVYRKQLLVENPFPVFNNENFLGEVAVWNVIAFKGYKIRWFNKTICKTEYLEDGLTKNNDLQTKVINYCGYTYTEKLNYKYSSFPHNYLAIARFIEVSRIKKRSMKDIKMVFGINTFQIYFGFLLMIIRKIYKIFKS